jgi:hypothetical protein
MAIRIADILNEMAALGAGMLSAQGLSARSRIG